ncbi:polysaccharide deacetylase family protein [Plantactinospora sp. CA-294935]|uniref:polysaccharide deacetylase family protein n=1 Tax=Plantactinospora sp. CA-294935 TaxID=3240012 RepID=UPI003D8A5ECB
MSRLLKLGTTAFVAAVVLAGSYVLVRVLTDSEGGRRSTVSGPISTTGSSGPASSAPASPDVVASPSIPSTPVPTWPLGAEQGGPYGARVTTGSSQVALTFDDGPDPRYTPPILALLRQSGVKATFCLVGVNVRAHPDLVRAIAADGHTLCNHSWAHDLRLGSRSRSAILADLTRTNQAIRSAVPGVPIPYFRQPGGAWTRAVVRAAQQLQMTSLHWAVDPRDWARPGARNIIRTVTSDVYPGAIVLLHDAGGDRRATVKALRSMLPALDRRFPLAAMPTGAPMP